MKTQLLGAALVAAAGLAGAACAGTPAPREGETGGHGQMKVLVIVSSHGLDLTSDLGADQFLRRLTSAVDAACDDRPIYAPTLRLGRTVAFDRCRSQALEMAMTYVHSPIVKRRYAVIEARDGIHLARR